MYLLYNNVITLVYTLYVLLYSKRAHAYFKISIFLYLVYLRKKLFGDKWFLFFWDFFVFTYATTYVCFHSTVASGRNFGILHILLKNNVYLRCFGSFDMWIKNIVVRISWWKITLKNLKFFWTKKYFFNIFWLGEEKKSWIFYLVRKFPDVSSMFWKFMTV